MRLMRSTKFLRTHARRRRPAAVTTIAAAVAFVLAAAVLFQVTPVVTAAGWNGIEPLKSKRADVERLLGKPLPAQSAEADTLSFKVAGGTVMILFVDAKFVAAKRLQPALEGTVLQVVLRHERATDTPETLGLLKNSSFAREDGQQGVVVFRNLKDGIYYTFVNGQLKTSRFSPTADQLASGQRR